MKLTLPRLLIIGSLLCATAQAETSVFSEYRMGRFDTQGATKTIGSPSLGFLTSLDRQNRHSVGLAYSRYAWSSSHSWSIDTGSTGEVGQNTEARSHWDALYLLYQYKQPLSGKLHVYFRGKVGEGKAHTRATVNQFGGFAGPLKYTVDAKSKTALASEIDLGLAWEINSHWLLRAGAGYSHLEGRTGSGVWYHTDLKGPQAHAGISYTF